MPRYRDGGRVKLSPTSPKLFENRRSNSTETKYYGLKRDSALLDLTKKDDALSEVLKDIQDPSEASALGTFSFDDLSVISSIISENLKKEDFEIVLNSSINVEDEEGNLTALISPRQRISDRITQLESVAGRGTNFVGQGGVLFKYVVGLDTEWSHTNPPPFFTEDLTSTIENAPDFIPSTPAQIESTHRIGYILNGEFTPLTETEWWWSGEYNHDWVDEVIRGTAYADSADNALSDPTFPIVKDGNFSFSTNYAHDIDQTYNWGLRIDAWFKPSSESFYEVFREGDTFAKFCAQVNGHLRIDYFEKTGYDLNTNQIQGTWKVALDTTDPSTHFVSFSKESPTQSQLGYRKYFIQGGPSTSPGAGSGTLTISDNSLDLNLTYQDREGNDVLNYLDDYVPIVIRFWYGKPSQDNNVSRLDRSPDSPAGFQLETLSINSDSASLSNWNDYSSQLRLIYTESSWTVDTSAGGSVISEDNFINYNSTFEILGYSNLNSSKPASVDLYSTVNTLVLAQKINLGSGIFGANISLPGISPLSGETIWVIAKNRPRITGPHTIANPLLNPGISNRALFQKSIFNPSPTQRYKNVNDLLEGIGENYVEPDPSKRIFLNNPKYYQAKHGSFPDLGTFGPSRYDGTIRNSISEVVNSSHDYSHDKLLFIGRQVKSTQSKPLAEGEVRLLGENYTFIEFKENRAGFGGNVVINAYPVNSLAVQDTTQTGTFGKFLNMSDNTDVFSNPSRTNSPGFDLLSFPQSFGTTETDPDNKVLLYTDYGAEVILQAGSFNGTTYSPDNTGLISNLTVGTPPNESDFVSGFISNLNLLNGTSPLYLYSPLLFAKKVVSSGTFTADTNTITSSSLFSNRGQTAYNNQYIGTRIRAELVSDPLVTIDVLVNSYNATSQTVTLNQTITAGQYRVISIDYNEFLISKSLPNLFVNNSGGEIGVVIPSDPASIESVRLIGIDYTLLPFYIYNKVDNGSGLSFGETLFVNNTSEDPEELFTPSPEQPFYFGAEVPGPPSALVTPFGYDNSPSDSDPGLGGICYPPYSSQDFSLSPTVVNDTDLYSSGIGQFDVWWGSKNADILSLGGKSLTILDNFSFDFDPLDRDNLFVPIQSNALVRFDGSEYTHKIELKTKVLLPDVSSSGNENLIKDAIVHSNLEPVRDTYYIPVNINNSNEIRIISSENPNWN